MTTASRARSIRRRGSSRAGKNDPVPQLGDLAARHRRPSSTTAGHGCRCGGWCGWPSVRSGRRRSARWPRPRSAPAALAPGLHGPHPDHRRHAVHPAVQTGQTDRGPSWRTPWCEPWQEHTELHAMAPRLATQATSLPSNPTTPWDANPTGPSSFGSALDPAADGQEANPSRTVRRRDCRQQSGYGCLHAPGALLLFLGWRFHSGAKHGGTGRGVLRMALTAGRCRGNRLS